MTVSVGGRSDWEMLGRRWGDAGETLGVWEMAVEYTE